MLFTPHLSSPGPLTFNSSVPSKPTDGDVTSNGSASDSSSRSKEYNRQLTALNCSVRDWITKHVNDNPLCDLNPIFRDYERHLASIEKKYGSGASDGTGESAGEQKSGAVPSGAGAGVSGSNAAPSLFSFKGKESTAAEKPAAPAGVSFNFGQKVDSSVLSSLGSGGPPSFSFSTSGTSAFGAAAPALSTSGTAPGNSKTAGTRVLRYRKREVYGEQLHNVLFFLDENEEESDEPPVPVVKEIKEKDAFYSKK